jgi:hypothetical protein
VELTSAGKCVVLGNPGLLVARNDDADDAQWVSCGMRIYVPAPVFKENHLKHLYAGLSRDRNQPFLSVLPLAATTFLLSLRQEWLSSSVDATFRNMSWQERCDYFAAKAPPMPLHKLLYAAMSAAVVHKEGEAPQPASKRYDGILDALKGLKRWIDGITATLLQELRQTSFMGLTAVSANEATRVRALETLQRQHPDVETPSSFLYVKASADVAWAVVTHITKKEEVDNLVNTYLSAHVTTLPLFVSPEPPSVLERLGLYPLPDMYLLDAPGLFADGKHVLEVPATDVTPEYTFFSASLTPEHVLRLLAKQHATAFDTVFNNQLAGARAEAEAARARAVWLSALNDRDDSSDGEEAFAAPPVPTLSASSSIASSDASLPKGAASLPVPPAVPAPPVTAAKKDVAATNPSSITITAAHKAAKERLASKSDVGAILVMDDTSLSVTRFLLSDIPRATFHIVEPDAAKVWAMTEAISVLPSSQRTRVFITFGHVEDYLAHVQMKFDAIFAHFPTRWHLADNADGKSPAARIKVMLASQRLQAERLLLVSVSPHKDDQHRMVKDAQEWHRGLHPLHDETSAGTVLCSAAAAVGSKRSRAVYSSESSSDDDSQHVPVAGIKRVRQSGSSLS